MRTCNLRDRKNAILLGIFEPKLGIFESELGIFGLKLATLEPELAILLGIFEPERVILESELATLRNRSSNILLFFRQ